MGTTHNNSDQEGVVHQHGYEDDVEQAWQRGTSMTAGGRDEGTSRAVCWRRDGQTVA
jgi:hypothetical protein